MTEPNESGAAAEPGNEPATFEAALGELQQIVAALEDGSLGLEESLARYERGVALLRRCHGVLQAAERRIEILTGFDAAGRPTTAPFDAEATFEGSGAASQSAGRRGGRAARDAGTAGEAGESTPSGTETPASTPRRKRSSARAAKTAEDAASNAPAPAALPEASGGREPPGSSASSDDPPSLAASGSSLSTESSPASESSATAAPSDAGAPCANPDPGLNGKNVAVGSPAGNGTGDAEPESGLRLF